MATKGGNQKTRKADPMRTKNGKERLGPLNINQLEKLLSNARKKHVAKIHRRINVLKSRPSFVKAAEAVSAEAVVESVVE
jgi:hypothetical protein